MSIVFQRISIKPLHFRKGFAWTLHPLSVCLFVCLLQQQFLQRKQQRNCSSSHAQCKHLLNNKETHSQHHNSKLLKKKKQQSRAITMYSQNFLHSIANQTSISHGGRLSLNRSAGTSGSSECTTCWGLQGEKYCIWILTRTKKLKNG